MKTIQVRRQVRLGLMRAVEICASGIYFRLFRSLVTVAVVTVAIAFMVYMLGGNAIRRGVRDYIVEEVRDDQLLERWMSWLAEPMSRTVLMRVVAGCDEGDFRLQSVRVWGGLSVEEAEGLYTVARSLNRYFTAFDALPPGRRFMLAEESGGESLLEALPDEAALNRFAQRLRQQGNLELPGSLDELFELLRRYWKQIPLWERVARGRNAAMARLVARYPSRTAAELLADPPPGFREFLDEQGFVAQSVDRERVIEKARRERVLNHWASLLRHRGFAAALSAHTRIPVTQLNLETLARVYLSRGGPAFVESVLRQRQIDFEPPAGDGAVEVFTDYLEQQHRLAVGMLVDTSDTGQSAGERRTLWLVGVAFMVCVVGIANAMLMSVMERFREIATMKCLGATDGFVMMLFVLESCAQGLVGGILGAVLGLLVALPPAAAQFGSILWRTLDLNDMLGAVGAALVTGIVLAAVASVYPAYVAARLAPMEAMRLE